MNYDKMVTAVLVVMLTAAIVLHALDHRFAAFTLACFTCGAAIGAYAVLNWKKR